MISVIVPAYQAEKTLPHTLNSIRRQTFDGFEVVVVNDGSTDDTLAVAEYFAGRDARFKVIDQQNQGTGAAINNGIASANGDLLVVVDADDEIAPTFLATVHEDATAYPEYDMWIRNTAIHTFYGGVFTFLPWNERREVTVDDLLLGHSIPGAGTLFSRRLFDAVGGYSDLEMAEDTEFWFKALTSGFRCIFHPGSLYRYNVREGGRSSDLSKGLHVRVGIVADLLHRGCLTQPQTVLAKEWMRRTSAELGVDHPLSILEAESGPLVGRTILFVVAGSPIASTPQRLTKLANEVSLAGGAVAVVAMSGSIGADHLERFARNRVIPGFGTMLSRAPARAVRDVLRAFFSRPLRLGRDLITRRIRLRELAAMAFAMTTRPSAVIALGPRSLALAHAAAESSGAPLVLDTHGCTNGNGSDSSTCSILDPKDPKLVAEALGDCALVLATDEMVADSISRDFRIQRMESLPQVPDARVDEVERASSPIRMVTFADELNGREGLERLLRTVKLLEGAVTLDILGADRPDVESGMFADVHRLGVGSSVQVMGDIDPDRVVATLAAYDLGVIAPRIPLARYRHYLPDRAYEMMNAGLALAVCEAPALSRFVERLDIGIVLDTSTASSLAEGIRLLIDDPERLLAYKRSALAAARHGSWRHHADTFVGALSEVAHPSRGDRP